MHLTKFIAVIIIITICICVTIIGSNGFRSQSIQFHFYSYSTDLEVYWLSGKFYIPSDTFRQLYSIHNHEQLPVLLFMVVLTYVS